MSEIFYDQFQEIIANRLLTPYFQPIVSLVDRSVIGFEALIRGPINGPFYTPSALFEVARRRGTHITRQLNLLCLELSVHRFLDLKLSGQLFVNIEPEALLDQLYLDIPRCLERAGIPNTRVVLELTEHSNQNDSLAIQDIVMSLRLLGLNIAVDDLGSGYSSLQRWAELLPDYVKIDRYFINNLQNKPEKHQFIRSILQISRELQCSVIGEGVETEAECLTLHQLGLSLYQGHYVGHPQMIPTLNIPRLAQIKSIRTINPFITPPENVASLLVESLAIGPDTSVETVSELFQTDSTLYYLPVVNNEIPVGMVQRLNFMDIFLKRYGRELHGKKPINQFMENNPLMLEQGLSLEKASRIVTAYFSKGIHRQEAFIVTNNGCYQGLVWGMDLLEKITAQRIHSARYANPLTLLPGNIFIHQHIDTLLAHRRPFAVAHCDLDNFKPFNDAYGYSQGDQVIQDLGEILVAYTDAKIDLVGHIGGDDFVVIFESTDWHAKCQAILARFAEVAASYYGPDDRAQGGIWSSNRQGEKTFFPMISLSIGVVIPDPDRCCSHHDVAILNADAKHEAKRLVGNSLFIDRRTGPSGSQADRQMASDPVAINLYDRINLLN